MPVKNVVVVEPDEAHRDILSDLLVHHGYVVTSCQDQGPGFERIRELLPDLVVLAFPLTMPDGRTLTESIRADSATAAIPILAVTAETRPEMIDRARHLGCTDYCSKPVDPRLLAVQVHDMIGPSLPD